MGNTDVVGASALSLAAAIRERALSPVEVLDACLERVDSLNGQVNAVVWRDDDEARRKARDAADAVLRVDPADLPAFHGVPIPIKDLTPVAGWPVTYGSWGAPAGRSDESALVVDAFKRAGFVLASRTNTPEFGPITVAENDRYGLTRNPWNRDLTPGGSSGGAGAAVASGMFPLAHANDGGGSIRIPASCCGLVGLKVSRGRVPAHYNSWEGGSVEGVVTRDVADTAAVLDAISGFDRGQWYNAPPPVRPYSMEVGVDPGSLRIGLIETSPFGLPMAIDCLDAVRGVGTALEKLGHQVSIVEFEVPDDFLASFMSVVNSGLADYQEIDWDRTEPHIRRARSAAAAIDSLTYVDAVHRLQRFTRSMVARWGGEFDLLVSPTMTITPPKSGEILAEVHANDGSGPSLKVFQMAALTAGFNMTGQPAISLPTHMTAGGLPVGVQVVAGPWDEALLIRIASQIEQALPWSDRTPPV